MCLSFLACGRVYINNFLLLVCGRVYINSSLLMVCGRVYVNSPLFLVCGRVYKKTIVVVVCRAVKGRTGLKRLWGGSKKRILPVYREMNINKVCQDTSACQSLLHSTVVVVVVVDGVVSVLIRHYHTARAAVRVSLAGTPLRIARSCPDTWSRIRHHNNTASSFSVRETSCSAERPLR